MLPIFIPSYKCHFFPLKLTDKKDLQNLYKKVDSKPLFLDESPIKFVFFPIESLQMIIDLLIS